MTRYNIKNAVAIGVSDAGELICIPRTSDPQTVGFLGKKRMGKTLSMNGVCGRSYCTYKEDIFIVANDYLNESPHWLEKQDNKKFKKTIENIGDRPTKIPFVPIYPNHKELKVDKNLPYYYKFGLPYEEFIKNMEDYFDIKRSLPYFKNIISNILKLKNQNIDSISEEIMEGKMNRDSKMMLINMISSFINEGRLDLEEETIGKVELRDGKKKEGVYDLISGLAYARHIPVLMTRDTHGKDYLQPYFASILRTIFKNQLEGYSDKYGKILHMFVDEIGVLTEKDKPTPCTKILNEFVVQGGPARIAFYYATQNPSKLPRKIKTNTKYTICFGLDKSEVKYVDEITPFSKRIKTEITTLKKGEFIANTIDEEWLLIDPYKKNNNAYIGSGVVRGKSLFPLSSTQPPIRRE